MLHSIVDSIILSYHRIVGRADGNAEGCCMHPVITHGDSYSVKEIRGRIQRNSIVLVVFDPEWLPANDNRHITYIIKRVKDVNKVDGSVYLLGDNPMSSYDSRHFGWVSRERIVGEVVLN